MDAVQVLEDFNLSTSTPFELSFEPEMGPGHNLTDEEVIAICGEPVTDDTFLQMRFFSSGVIVCAVGAFGLVGNILTCLTLKTMSMTLFNKLLLTLALTDLIFILAGGAFMTNVAFGYKSDLYTAVFPILTYPMAGLSMTGSTYLCVAISVERYLGICHRTIKLHRKFRFYLIGIIVLTFTIESPRFFELVGTTDNGTYSYKYAKHRWSASYVTYYCMWFRLFATALVPLIALIFFNAKILIYYRDNNFTRAHTVMRKMNQQRPNGVNFIASGSDKESQLSDIECPNRRPKRIANFSEIKANSSSHKAHRERTLFIMLCCITFTFFICHLPRICINVYEFVYQESIIVCDNHLNTPWNLPRWGRFTNEVSNALLIINSSANFVYYCLVGRAFRQHLVGMLKKYCSMCCRSVRSKNSSRHQNSPETGGANTMKPTADMEMSDQSGSENADSIKLIETPVVIE